MAEEDMAKTVFVTYDCIYCYTRMPFGLKNVGVDFQEGMNKAFEGLIGVIVEITLKISLSYQNQGYNNSKLEASVRMYLQNWNETESQEKHLRCFIWQMFGLHGFSAGH